MYGATSGKAFLRGKVRTVLGELSFIQLQTLSAALVPLTVLIRWFALCTFAYSAHIV
jgi:hypothetical protein